MSDDGGDAILKMNEGDDVGRMVGVRKTYTQSSPGAARKGEGEGEPFGLG
jgi:hypothetical protein